MGMLGTIAVGCACASLALCIVSIALPFWVYYEYSNGLAKTYYGLWTSCVSVASETQCNSITIGARMAEWSKELTCTILCWHPFPVGVGTISGLVKQVPDYFPSVRALEIMGLLLVAGAGVIGTLKLSVMKENQIISLVAGGQAILAGIFMLIGAIVFAVRTTPDLVPNGPTLHAGFALAIVSGLVAFGAAGLFIVNNFIKVSP